MLKPEAERLDTDPTLAAAVRAQEAGAKLSARQVKALQKWEREQIDHWGTRLLEEFPKGVLCDLLGVQQKVMLEKSRTFGLDYHTSGKTCRPIELLAGLLAWTTEHKRGIERLIKSERLTAALGDDEDDLDFWQTELVKERTLDLREKREERQGAMAPRDLIHDLLQELLVRPVASRLERLDKRSGAVAVEEARGWYEEDLKRAADAIERLLAEDDDEHEDDEGPSQDSGARAGRVAKQSGAA